MMKSFTKCAVILSFLFSPAYSLEFITNPYRTDGFGAQYQTIIYSVIYAEIHKKAYLYTPFSSMEHNYEGDGDFIQKKEWLVNMRDHYPVNYDGDLQKKISAADYIQFFERHLNQCANSHSLKKLKSLFRKNKKKSDYFHESYLNIAIHVRRPNAHDSRTEGTDTIDTVYLKTMNALRYKYRDCNIKFHIYSQGEEKDFASYKEEDTILHINSSIEDTFTSMVLADVLVTSRSSFSYTAAILSEGTVYYMPFWHPPLPSWLKLPSY